MLADELLVLLHHPETGRPLVSGHKLRLALAGALVVELVDRGRVALTARHPVTRNRSLLVTDPSPTGHDVLDGALRRISTQRSTRAHVVLSKIAKDAATDVLEGTSTDAEHAEDPKHVLRLVLLDQRTPTTREVAILSLLHAVGATAKVLEGGGVDGKELKRRAKTSAHGDPVADVVRQAIDAAAF